LRRWLSDHDDLVAALIHLRCAGEPAEAAVSAVLDLRGVRALRLSYELWEALCEGEGLDADRLLSRSITTEQLDRLSTALWGDRVGVPRLALVSDS
jgi:hypothetical protein